MQGIRIGELLIEQGVLSERQVRHILTVQRTVNRPFGDLAERLYGIDPHAVEDAWVDQYLQYAGTTDLKEASIDKDCLRLINRRQAWQFHVLPLFRSDEHLSVATTSESLVRAVNFATRKFHEPVYFVIAERQQLKELLMQRYPVPQFIAEFAETF